LLTNSFSTILLATAAKPSGNSYSSFSIFWNIIYSLLWTEKGGKMHYICHRLNNSEINVKLTTAIAASCTISFPTWNGMEVDQKPSGI
jgi:hypothetical protein